MNEVNNSTIVSDAIATLNEAAAAQAQQAARLIIGNIQSYQATVKDNTSRITALQAELARVSSFEFTVESVLGAPAPANSNTETITETINTLNKERQDQVKLSTARITQGITSLQESNIEIGKKIAELQVKLAAVKVETVDQATVTGTPAQS